MKASEKILKYMKGQDIFYLKNEENTIFELPYEVDDKYRVKIHMVIDDENRLVSVGFIAPLMNESQELKDEILRLNPRLVKGAMGISETRSDRLEYKLTFHLEGDMTKELYADTVEFSLKLYKNLINKKILKDERINEK